MKEAGRNGALQVLRLVNEKANTKMGMDGKSVSKEKSSVQEVVRPEPSLSWLKRKKEEPKEPETRKRQKTPGQERKAVWGRRPMGRCYEREGGRNGVIPR